MSKVLKLGQVLGVLVMAAGVTACQMNNIESTPFLVLIGGSMYAGCRLAAWMHAT